MKSIYQEGTQEKDCDLIYDSPCHIVIVFIGTVYTDSLFPDITNATGR